MPLSPRRRLLSTKSDQGKQKSWFLLGLAALLCLTLSGCLGFSSSRSSQADQAMTLPSSPAQEIPPASGQAGSFAQLADSDWLEARAQATDIPRRVLAAYAAATLRVAESYPQCRLGWNTLPGIGATETLHGTYRGSSTAEDGRVSPAIYGPALDGSPGVMAIADTDQGRLDADRRWDRAVGPLQFIPSTWAYLGQDANGDGTADPHNIDDAALTAAVYLCQEGRDLTTDEGWQQAVLAYNRSVAYANQVASSAENYGQAASRN